MPAGTFCSSLGLPSRTGRKRGQTKRDNLVLQEWGFYGWVGNPLKENKILINKDAQPWI